MTIGITGGIGSGKSIVAKILETIGHPVFYSDAVAKELMQSNAELKSEIIAHFGIEAFCDGELNRAFIATKIFSNPQDKEVLNELVHPKVRAKFVEFAVTHANKLIFNEAAILFETGAYCSYDKTILVTAPRELRIIRVMERDMCSREDVENRMKNQWEDDKKISLADYCIENDEQQPVIVQLETIVNELTVYSTSS